ncbi:MAG: ABC-2 transporter permease [Christensenellales bacterium]|nr:ABC-2 transporter permease [Christensenellales bacterium]
MIAVLKHELRLYFHSLTAYVFGAFLLAFVGIGAMLYNIQAAVSNFEFVLSFGSLVFVVIVPILTMRVIAEERKQKTDQLLYALPITTTQVILGKYLALLVVYLIPLALISLYPPAVRPVWRGISAHLLWFYPGLFCPGGCPHRPGGVHLLPHG